MVDRSPDSVHGLLLACLAFLLLFCSLPPLTAQDSAAGDSSHSPDQTDLIPPVELPADDSATEGSPDASGESGELDSLSVDGAESADAEADQGDSGAELFVATCSGCHSIGEGKRKGPDLAPTSNWPKADLVSAIKRMEKEVGPLNEEKVANLYAFLSDSHAKARLADAEAAVLARFAAKVEPGSVSTGSVLFSGAVALENGGPACIACHSAEGSGASFAVSLDSVVARLGEVPLASAIASASFPVMGAAYGQRPITSQEVAHLVAYLKSAQKKMIRSAGTDIEIPALIIAFACILFVAFYYRNRHQNSSAVAGRR